MGSDVILVLTTSRKSSATVAGVFGVGSGDGEEGPGNGDGDGKERPGNGEEVQGNDGEEAAKAPFAATTPTAAAKQLGGRADLGITK